MAERLHHEENRYWALSGSVIMKHAPEREQATPSQLGTTSPLTGFNLDPSTGEVYQDTGSAIAHYSAGCPTESGPCAPLDTFGAGDLSGGTGVGVDGETHTVYVANSGSGEVGVFKDIRPIVLTSLIHRPAPLNRKSPLQAISIRPTGGTSRNAISNTASTSTTDTRCPVRPIRPPRTSPDPLTSPGR